MRGMESYLALSALLLSLAVAVDGESEGRWGEVAVAVFYVGHKLVFCGHKPS